MKRILVAVTAGLAVALSLIGHAQGVANFAGKWTFQQARSKPDLAVGFPTELEIKQTANELTLTGTSNHQDPYTATYKFDGSETKFDTPAGAMTAKATWEGGKLVAQTRRSYTGPQGEITVETKEVYSLNGDALTVERTQTLAGRTNTGITVYTK